MDKHFKHQSNENKALWIFTEGEDLPDNAYGVVMLASAYRHLIKELTELRKLAEYADRQQED